MCFCLLGGLCSVGSAILQPCEQLSCAQGPHPTSVPSPSLSSVPSMVTAALGSSGHRAPAQTASNGASHLLLLGLILEKGSWGPVW